MLGQVVDQADHGGEGDLESVDVVPGEYVKQNQVVITLATLDTLRLETTDLSERDIMNVRVGAPVSIFIEALQETFSGEVMAVSPIADTVGGDVVFKVTIAFDEQPKDLFWGMTAEVTIDSQ
jgi:multidrug efflux pump subunit AcrA (membrane-fusion protein)